MTAPLRLVVHAPARGGDAVELSLAVPSDLALVGDAVELLARHCDTGVLSPRRLQFNLRTALAEALANAIAYGNREDPRKSVRVHVALRRDVVRIEITDDGDGFDPDAVSDPTTPENLEREEGRGLFVLRHIVDDVGFNAKGNVLWLILRAG